MDRLVVGWSAGHHVGHPCGWQSSPWPARKVTEYCSFLSEPSLRRSQKEGGTWELEVRCAHLRLPYGALALQWGDLGWHSAIRRDIWKA